MARVAEVSASAADTHGFTMQVAIAVATIDATLMMSATKDETRGRSNGGLDRIGSPASERKREHCS